MNLRKSLLLYNLIGDYLPDNITDLNPSYLKTLFNRLNSDNKMMNYLKAIEIMYDIPINTLVAEDEGDVLQSFIDGLLRCDLLGVRLFLIKLGMKNG